MTEDGQTPDTNLKITADHEQLIDSASVSYHFPDLDENTKATTFYTTGTTGNPKGVHFTHRQLVLHTLGVAVQTGSCWAFPTLPGILTT